MNNSNREIPNNPENEQSKMQDILKTKETRMEAYPDELKTHPEAEEKVEKISKNVKQNSENHEEYPDNLKTNP